MDPILQWMLGAIVTTLIAICGGFIKYLFGVIKGHKEDTTREVSELYTHVNNIKSEIEDKRKETRDLLLELINTKFDAIWESIKDLKERERK